jgi:hypothetical protein
MAEKVLQIEYGSEMSDTEKGVGKFLLRPYVHLAIVVVVLIILLFLASKAGFDIWLLNKIGLESLVSERGEPDFWQIGNELAAYKASQVAPMRAEASSDSSGLNEGQSSAAPVPVMTPMSATSTSTASGKAVPASTAVAAAMPAIQAAGASAEYLYSGPPRYIPKPKREYITGNMGKVDSARLRALLA